MKTIFTLLTLSVLVLGAMNPLHANSCSKVWNYGYTGNYFKWVYRYTDQWGGYNEQCVMPGSSCGQWDWRATYAGDCNVMPTPGYTNNAIYGDYLVRQQAAQDGTALPSDLGTPTYSVIWEGCDEGSGLQ